MRSRRQQQQQQQHDAACGSINISKKHSTLVSSKRPIGGAGSFAESVSNMVHYGPNEYDRDESPVSVISHSATIVSQPSSACASMEHLNHLISHSGKQRSARSSIQQSPLSQSTATSGASTSEDDSTASCNMSNGFIVATEVSSQKQHFHGKEETAARIATDKHYLCEEESVAPMQASMKPIQRLSDVSQLDNATDGLNTEDEQEDDHAMFSIDLQGLKLDTVNQKQNVLKRSGMRLIDGRKKHCSVDQLSVISKQHSIELEENQSQCNMSTPSAPKELSSAKSLTNWLASKVVNHAEILSKSRAPVTQSGKNHDTISPKAPVRAFRITPSVISRQRSLHSGSFVVPSKWDDAEKWLCHDNRQVLQYQSTAKSASVPEQTSVTSNNSTPNSGELSGGVSKHLKHKEDTASSKVKGLNVDAKDFESRSEQSSSSSWEKFRVRKAHRDVDNAGTHSILARHAFVQNVMVNSGKGLPSSIGTALSAGNVACSPQSSSSNEMSGHTQQMHSHVGPSKGKWKKAPPQANAFPRSARNHTSSGEIANAQPMLHRRSSAISVSDGEISRQSSCKHHCISPPMFVSNEMVTCEKEMKDCTHQTSNKPWIRDYADTSRMTQCKCSYAMSSTAIHRPAEICESDGKVCETGARSEQLESSSSYMKRFKQHQILQKLRRKCSQKQGAIPANTCIHKANEEAGENELFTKACSQKEFVVQTPTHGRSASMKDACTEVSPSLSRRDIGTQVTPAVGSPATSKSVSPLQNNSPARHNTPTQTSPTPLRKGDYTGSSRESEDETDPTWRGCNNVSALTLGSSQWAKLELRERPSGAVQTSENNSDLGSVNIEWSPSYGLEEDSGVMDGGHSATEDNTYSVSMVMKRRDALDARAAAWEDSERVKLSAKFKREEARISAWETLQKGKAQADLKKLEVKLEKLRAKATAKVMSRVASAQKRAEDMRAAAEVQQAEQVRKMKEKACSLRRNALFPAGFTVCFARTYMA